MQKNQRDRKRKHDQENQDQIENNKKKIIHTNDDQGPQNNDENSIKNLQIEENKKQPNQQLQDLGDIIYFDVEPVQETNQKTTNQKESLDEKQLAPWISSSTLSIKNPLYRLHNEIIELTDYLAPTQEEHQLRIKTLETLTSIIKAVIPDCEVKTFGSFSSKLYLPNSDIDVVILKEGEQNKQLYKKVADVILSREDIYENINLITNAKVPLIKLVEKATQTNFDISFNKDDGVRQLEEVQKSLQIYPEMRDLNETYTGGIGSFLLFCMVLAFLRELRKEYKENNRLNEMKNITLGEYLLKMFKFYINFDVDRKKILMVNQGTIVDKEYKDRKFSLISPQDPTHDIGNSSFKIKESIFPLFKNRYQFFTNYNFKPQESVLKYLVNPSGGIFTFQKEDK